MLNFFYSKDGKINFKDDLFTKQREQENIFANKRILR